MNTAFRLLLEAADEGAIDRIQKLPDAASQLADKDYWGSVGIMALTGIMVVFLILAILIFFFWLMGVIFKAIDKSKAEKKASVEAAKPDVPAPVIEAASAPEAAAEDNDEELIAVITAAIAAYEESGDFTIKSVRKRGDKNPQARSAWSMAGLNGSMRQF